MRLANRATGAVDAGAGRRARTQILAVADAVAIGIDAAIATARDGIDDRQFAVLCRRSEEHTSELQSLMRISYAVFCLKKKTTEDKTQPKQEHLYNTQAHDEKTHRHHE